MTAVAMASLHGRTLLLTGASSGIGAHFAGVAAAAGARLVLGARRTELLEEVVAAIRTAGGEAIAVAMDVADKGSTVAAFDAAEAAFGPVDSVIANAGMSLETPFLDHSPEDFDRIMAVNLKGVFLTVQEAAKRMMAAGSATREHGRIVIVSSITAQAIEPGLAAYSASKAAVLQMGKVLAREWARKGINVNSVLPGYIVTGINADWFATEGGQKQVMRFPRKRVMDIDALDPVLLYLCSDAARFVTGSAFTIDDGQSL
jgi:NAD(P)-dependent dehydrogenase (short-subunit alcohol dehydrogenase family)